MSYFRLRLAGRSDKLRRRGFVTGLGSKLPYSSSSSFTLLEGVNAKPFIVYRLNVLPVSRSMAINGLSSSSLNNDMATPCAPALPVRPIRCT